MKVSTGVRGPWLRGSYKSHEVLIGLFWWLIPFENLSQST